VSIRSRLRVIERAMNFGRSRLIIVLALGGLFEEPKGVAGSIDVWPNGAGFNMYVPEEFAPDPIAGLDSRQCEFLRTGDEIQVSGEYYTTGKHGAETLSTVEYWINWLPNALRNGTQQ
jgi:hypothetical protein